MSSQDSTKKAKKDFISDSKKADFNKIDSVSDSQIQKIQNQQIQKIIEGKAWKFGDNIDTDVIIAARYLNTSDENILARHIMEDARPDFFSEISKGDIIVAGENFGCGSSREHAPIALKAAGIACVIAPSFARIFYRNAFNMGLLILESNEVNHINEGDKIRIDTQKGIIQNLTTNQSFAYKEIPEFMHALLQSGGLMAFAKDWLRKNG
ncbi:3-isopropylmalate dehydratase small subunit [Helicobacter sp. T3_23-1056]